MQRRLGAFVGEVEQHAHHRHAIADGVVDAQHQRDALLVILDDMNLPKGMTGVERAHREFANEPLQLRLAARPGQARASQVARDVEARVLAPMQSARVDNAAETVVGEQPRRKRALQPFEIDRFAQHDHPDDHHVVVRPVHSQPGDVHRRHARIFRHGSLPLF